MAGKSTWIASMLNKKAYEKLQSVSKNNSEGQTKIPIRYYMENSSDDKQEKYFRFPNDGEDVALQE